jgi:hypothetical protein
MFVGLLISIVSDDNGYGPGGLGLEDNPHLFYLWFMFSPGVIFTAGMFGIFYALPRLTFQGKKYESKEHAYALQRVARLPEADQSLMQNALNAYLKNPVFETKRIFDDMLGYIEQRDKLKLSQDTAVYVEEAKHDLKRLADEVKELSN